MIYDLRTYFLLFMIYSFIGWIIEIIDIYIYQKKIINRGFLIGPYCPIYGFGSIAMILFLKKYLNDAFVLFLMAVLICSILEYTTSYLMEKIFKARWWDYSKNKFNINGRICLETMIPFGIGGVIIMYVVNPFLVNLLSLIPSVVLNVVAIILLIIFIADNIISFNIILNFKRVAKNIKQDSTEEITKMVRNVLATKSIFTKRLVNAFPNVQAIKLIRKRKKKDEKLSKRTGKNNK